MSVRRMLYWIIVGGLIGFGCISLESIGLPLVVLGAILLAVGTVWFGVRQLWAALVGFGAVPAVVLILDLVRGPWACSPANAAISEPGTTYYTCVETPIGLVTSYHLLAAGFAVIACAGAVWPVVGHFLKRTPSAA